MTSFSYLKFTMTQLPIPGENRIPLLLVACSLILGGCTTIEYKRYIELRQDGSKAVAVSQTGIGGTCAIYELEKVPPFGVGVSPSKSANTLTISPLPIIPLPVIPWLPGIYSSIAGLPGLDERNDFVTVLLIIRTVPVFTFHIPAVLDLSFCSNCCVSGQLST